jgi:DNA-binding response OmpR family regulator
MLDVTMLRPDSWEIALRLRKCPGTSPIKVVLMAAHDQAASPTRQSHADVDAYLAKPFDPREMIRVVRGLAGAKEARAYGSSIRWTGTVPQSTVPSERPRQRPLAFGFRR